MATVAVLDRSGVRPIEHDPTQDQRQPSWDPLRLTAEERPELRALLERAVGKSKP